MQTLGCVWTARRGIFTAAKTTSQPSHSKRSLSRPKAAGLIIGDEILNGSVTDTNSKTLATFFFKRGIDLKRIEIVPDDVRCYSTREVAIIDTVRRISPSVDYVVTSGGIGPTHDDITYECLAKAFSRRLAYHQPTLDRMEKSLKAKGQVINEARKRMALFPWPAEVHFWNEDRWVPIVQVDNVFILPGIPTLFDYMLEGGKHLFSGGQPPVSADVFTQLFEGEFAESLKQIQKSYGDMKIGSYPKMGDVVDYRARIHIEGFDPVRVQECALMIQRKCNGFRVTIDGEHLPSDVS